MQNELFPTTDGNGYPIFNPSNYRQENVWLVNRLDLALKSADDTAIRWFDNFLDDLGVEPDRAEIVFNRHREYHLEERQKYSRYNNLFAEFFKQGDFLQALTNRVHAMYLNSRHELGPEDLVKRIYAIRFILTHLNEWKAENSTIINSAPLIDDTPDKTNQLLDAIETDTISSKPDTSTSQPANNELLLISSVTEKKPNYQIPSQPELALFYYYCHEKNCLPPFQSGHMEQGYQEAVKRYGLSWKSFQQHYNRFKKKNQRMADGNRKALLGAIKMLESYPKALEMAKDELTTAETRKPLT